MGLFMPMCPELVAAFFGTIKIGAIVSAPLAWAIGTLPNGFMAFPNLISLFFLMGTVRRLTRNYLEKVDSSAR